MREDLWCSTKDKSFSNMIYLDWESESEFYKSRNFRICSIVSMLTVWYTNIRCYQAVGDSALELERAVPS